MLQGDILLCMVANSLAIHMFVFSSALFLDAIWLQAFYVEYEQVKQ
jgi:hypothetical protein